MRNIGKRFLFLICIYLFCLTTIFGNSDSMINIDNCGEHLKGTVLSVSSNNKSRPILSSINYKGEKKELSASQIFEENTTLSTWWNTTAVIEVNNIIVEMKPLTNLKLDVATINELSEFLSMWSLQKGEIFVDYDSKTHTNPKVIFNTNVNSILIRGTSFNLNERGYISNLKGEIDIYKLGDWSRDMLVSPNRDLPKEPLNHLKTGEVQGGLLLEKLDLGFKLNQDAIHKEGSFFENFEPNNSIPPIPNNNDNLPPPPDRALALPPMIDDRRFIETK